MIRRNNPATVALVAVLAACISALAQTNNGPALHQREQPGLPIAPGDLVDMSVLDTPELAARMRVDPLGDLTLANGDPVHVAGMTPQQAGSAIERDWRDAKFMNHPHVEILVSEYANQNVTVDGEVKSPGPYPVMGNRTLRDVIAAAGGVTPAASRSVSVLRRDQDNQAVILKFDSDHPRTDDGSYPILPGDTVVVKRSGIVYALGNVNRPGGFLVETNQRLTVLGTVALAQGVNATAALNNVRLIRQGPDGREEIKIELKKMLQAKIPDVPLQDGDILFVPSSTSKVVASRGAEAAVAVGTGILIYQR